MMKSLHPNITRICSYGLFNFQLFPYAKSLFFYRYWRIPKKPCSISSYVEIYVVSFIHKIWIHFQELREFVLMGFNIKIITEKQLKRRNAHVLGIQLQYIFFIHAVADVHAPKLVRSPESLIFMCRLWFHYRISELYYSQKIKYATHSSEIIHYIPK